MKILHTSEFYPPSTGGSQEVVRQLSERMAARGHEVTVATTRLPDRLSDAISGVEIRQFEAGGNLVQGLRGDVDGYRRFLLEGQFDVMMNYAAQQWTADAAFEVLDRLSYPKVLAPCGLSALFNPDYGEYFRAMPDIMRKYSRLVFHSSTYRDALFAAHQRLQHGVVIPNGAGNDEFESGRTDFRERYGLPSRVPLLLTVGSHTGLKGHAVVLEAFRRARIGKSVLVIIGNLTGDGSCRTSCSRRARAVEWLSLGRKRVMLLDPPRPDVVAAHLAADLFLFGSNVECCPLVLYEAMASGTPFVTADCGNAREIASESRAGIVLNTRHGPTGMADIEASDMAVTVESLLVDQNRRSVMAENGRAAWAGRFTWDRITEEYESLYESLA